MTKTLSRRTIVVSLAGTAFACRRQTPGRDRALVIVFGPQHTPANPDVLRARLEAASGLTLQVINAKSNEEALDLMQSGKADAGLLPLFEYFYCAGVFTVEPLVQLVRRGQTTMASELLVPAGAATRALAELAGQRVAYVDRSSVTGFLLPAAQLGEAKVHVEPVWLGTHDAVLEAVKTGKVAAGASYAGHGATTEGLRVLVTSAPIANEPLFVQHKVPAEVRDALAQALLAETDPRALAGLADATGFAKPTAGTWDAAQATLKSAGLSVEDTTAGGWLRANEHRVPSWARGP